MVKDDAEGNLFSRSLIIKNRINCLAIIISYGTSKGEMELFLPQKQKSCFLPKLGERRYGHTIDGLFVCGGGRTSGTCKHFENGRFLLLVFPLDLIY